MNVTADGAEAWLRRLRPSGPGSSTLVCFPHAGGAATSFQALAGLLAPETRVLAVQYPGRQDRRLEPVMSDVNELADHIARALDEAAIPEPVAFFGHSMGAIVAFEVALRLQERGATRAPTRLLASARRAPSRVRPDRIHQLSDRELIDHVLDLGEPGAQLLKDEELVPLLLPVIRADYQAIEAYRCRPDTVVRSAVSILWAEDDPLVTEAEALAWREHTDAGTDALVFPSGGHFYLSRHVREVAEHVRRQMLLPRAAAISPHGSGGEL